MFAGMTVTFPLPFTWSFVFPMYFSGGSEVSEEVTEVK